MWASGVLLVGILATVASVDGSAIVCAVDVTDKGGAQGSYVWNAGLVKQQCTSEEFTDPDSGIKREFVVQTCGHVYSMTPGSPGETYDHSWGSLSSIVYTSEEVLTYGGSFVLDFTGGDVYYPSLPPDIHDEGVDRSAHVTLQCADENDSEKAPTCVTDSIQNDTIVYITLNAPCPIPLSQASPFPDMTVTVGGMKVVEAGEAVPSNQIPVMSESTETILIKNTFNLPISIPRPTISATPNTSVTVTTTGDLGNGGTIAPSSSMDFTLTVLCNEGVNGQVKVQVLFPVTVQSKSTTYPGVPFTLTRTCKWNGSVGEQGMSAGGVFFLSIFVVTIVLCGGGYAYKYQQLGLRGWEAVPLVDTMRNGWSKLQDRMQHRTYTHDSVVAMQVTPAPVSYSTGYQDVAD